MVFALHRWLHAAVEMAALRQLKVRNKQFFKKPNKTYDYDYKKDF